MLALTYNWASKMLALTYNWASKMLALTYNWTSKMEKHLHDCFIHYKQMFGSININLTPPLVLLKLMDPAS
jgi:hypothetical protein